MSRANSRQRVIDDAVWADEAIAYNGLVIAWPELTKLARAERTKTTDTRQAMF